jgi:5-methylcytosine-specific restriction endonuclease McrA
MVMTRKKTDTDHICPTSEGGPEDSWNKREISPHRNRSKGSEMPNISGVMDSDNPLRLAAEIDKYTLTHKYNTARNRNRGFGGLKRK